MNKSQLHQASGLSPKTISRALDDWPQTRTATYAHLSRVLDDIESDRQPGEVEYIPSSESASPFTIEMAGVFGVQSVTFSGPAEDMDAVRKAAVEFLREARESAGGERVE